MSEMVQEEAAGNGGGGAPPRIRAGVYGASGTSGAELVGLLLDHPHVELVFGTARTEAGRLLSEVDPAAPALRLVHPDEAAASDVDLAFLCLPHGASGAMAARCIEAGARVVDLSGDHRLASAAEHARVYGSPRSQELAAEAVYGLTERARGALPGARLVANPGCYATAVSLALLPIAEAGLLADDLPVVDAKSGVSGAGRTPTATTHFCSASGDVRPYKPGRAHRHVAEVEQVLTVSDPERRAQRIVFTPHLVPIERGIEATIVLRGPGLTAAGVRRLLAERYDCEPFIQVLGEGEEARIRAAVRTNRCVLGVSPVEGLDAVVVTSAIDNLLKGAAGQAVQNMNAMMGLDERLGLPGPVSG